MSNQSDETIRVRSGPAMRAAMVDRQKFNECASNGSYSCAPGTSIGSVRIFEEDDLLALFVFGRLLELGVNARNAGHLSCEFKSSLYDRDMKRHDVITYVRGQMGDFFTANYDPELHYHGIGAVVFTIRFPVKDIWDTIIFPRLKYERSIIGVEGRDD